VCVYTSVCVCILVYTHIDTHIYELIYINTHAHKRNLDLEFIALCLILRWAEV